MFAVRRAKPIYKLETLKLSPIFLAKLADSSNSLLFFIKSFVLSLSVSPKSLISFLLSAIAPLAALVFSNASPKGLLIPIALNNLSIAPKNPPEMPNSLLICFWIFSISSY